jgi:ABC-type proline/glycine betaine transport system ATPase subunit
MNTDIKVIGISEALKLTIDTAEDLQLSNRVVVDLKSRLKEITDHKELVTKPLNEALKAERAKYKPLEDNLQQAIDHIRTQQAHYATSRAKVQLEASQAVTAGTATMEQALEAFTPDNTQGLTFRKSQRLVITDMKKVPRNYLIPNETFILTTLKAGKKIAGCELEEVAIPVNRKI